MPEIHYENLAVAMHDAIRLAGVRPDCCILATRATLDALDALGEKHAFPLSVRVNCFNPKLAEMVFAASERHGNDTEGAREELGALTDELVAAGAWAVTVGSKNMAPEQVSGWDGHLVAAIPDGDKLHLIDPTICVASRPTKHLHIPPMACTIPVTWLETQQTACHRFPDGAAVLYSTWPADTSYQAAPDWKGKGAEAKAFRRRLVDLALEIYRHMPFQTT